MGQELGALYYALDSELTWLYIKWGEYEELFGGNRSRVELLNQTANTFFYIVQETLWQNVLIHIARLLDPPRSAGNANLTLKKIPMLIDDETLKQKIEDMIEIAAIEAEFCRDWRNRKIAHGDLSLALGNSVEALPSATRTKVGKSLTSIVDVLNEISKYFFDNAVTLYENSIYSNGATSLLRVLDDGINAKIEREERMRKGIYLKADINRKKF